MREIVVLSGKGGTGKTSIVGSFAALAQDKVLADCDVDAADLHLLLEPSIKEDNEFWSGQVATIDEERCTQCGLCQDVCRFRAINDFKVDPVSCEGCGFCYHVCPADAITLQDCLSGHWFVSQTRYGPLVHARLGIGEENSGKLVAAVRQRARRIAEDDGVTSLITDGPPGIGCPVTSSLTGASLALVITEPTLSGMHDLDRVVGVCYHFGIPALVCINKYDINEENTRQIESYCHARGLPLVAKIRFDNVVTEALVQGIPVVEHSQNEVAQQIGALWEETSARIQ